MAVEIRGSVGRDGTNDPEDVGKVQSLLNAAGANPPLAVDRKVGPKTLRAINEFQAKFLREPDGRVDPGGRTLGELNKATGSRTVPPEENREWTGDSSRWSQEKKLNSLNPQFREKVVLVLADLRKRGFQPSIFFGWRSVQVQLELVRKGNSTVKFSFHNAQKKDGTPNAYAADVIDTRWGWEAAAEKNGFWKALGESAKAVGLYWGGDWTSFKDWAHIQYYPNSSLSQVKRESGL
ncbi:MAG TPA: peptidoglycan-binding protein [Isosphaeraceae bacterium]|jgi:peptidoglycan L-alanyl-D-glutamate endopeptidase CwlK